MTTEPNGQQRIQTPNSNNGRRAQTRDGASRNYNRIKANTDGDVITAVPESLHHKMRAFMNKNQLPAKETKTISNTYEIEAKPAATLKL